MKRLSAAFVTISLAWLAPTPSAADVKIQERTLVKFEGGLGRMIGLFGGKAAREGIVSTVAVKGDRKMTMSDQGGQLIDLAEEKIYDLDARNKRYTVTTFAQYRQRLEDAQTQAKRAAQEQAEAGRPADVKEAEVEVDVDVKETGQRKSVAGHDSRQVILTITVRPKGQTLEDGGGVVLTSDMWLAEAVPEVAEVHAFDRRYFAKLSGPLATGLDVQQMAAAFALYPAMKPAFDRLQQESGKLTGVALATTLTFEGVKSKAQMAEEAQRSQESGGGGIGGMLARRLVRKTPEEQSARGRILTSTHEVLSIATMATETDVAIPEGYKEKR